jgi:hypothetical protein
MEESMADATFDFDGLLEQDTFLGNWCARCGYHGILYATPRWFSACPRCLEERMRKLRETGVDLPNWFVYVENVARRHVDIQERQLMVSPTVHFDDFCHCAGCGRLLQQCDARYPREPGGYGSSPHCGPCFDVRQGR